MGITLQKMCFSSAGVQLSLSVNFLAGSHRNAWTNHPDQLVVKGTALEMKELAYAWVVKLNEAFEKYRKIKPVSRTVIRGGKSQYRRLPPLVILF